MCAILSQQTVHKVWRRHVVKSGADYLRFPYLDGDIWLSKVRDLQGSGLFNDAKFITVYQYFDFKY
ncbi:hypothetical protein O9G_004985 [Rozella allomycis CSF55]|uniref:Uncharacterized protein n=1 Tax=Rozella allomycis (strain CSF55) TaxID=988480 RepID=A0A075AUW5_ROZAC|nr:hypothetical protein O9G_004985 [Rozella allomycis CSF55]|eukprot:EPZ34048.1 hypothetical protein O9G_004985 [Rozella allomycis CSF55]